MEFLRRIRAAVQHAAPEISVQIRPVADDEGRYAATLSFEGGIQIQCGRSGVRDLGTTPTGRVAANRIRAISLALGIASGNGQRQELTAAGPGPAAQPKEQATAPRLAPTMSVIVFAENHLLDRFLTATLGPRPAGGNWPVTRLHPSVLETSQFQLQVAKYLHNGGHLECIYVQGAEHSAADAHYLSLLQGLPKGASAALASASPRGDFDMERLTPTRFEVEPTPDATTGVLGP